MTPCGRLPEMQVQYNSANRSSSKQKVTFDGSGLGVCSSGVTLDPALSPDLVGVQGSREEGRREPTCWARFVLKTVKQQKSTEVNRGEHKTADIVINHDEKIQKQHSVRHL